MELNEQTFLAAWEAATPLLQQDTLIQDECWDRMMLPEIFAQLEKALASEVVYGHYNENLLLAGGTLRTRILLKEQHYINYSALEAQETVSVYNPARLREIFVDDLFIENDELNTDLLFDWLEQGQRVYRS